MRTDNIWKHLERPSTPAESSLGEVLGVDKRMDGEGFIHQWRFDGVPLEPLLNAYGTPLYIYSAKHILDEFHAYNDHQEEGRVQVHFSIKANSNLAILRLLSEAGAGFDIVSGGELRRALTVGADPQLIVFSGVAKKDDELIAALEAGIGCFNVESAEELERLNKLALERQKRARVALRVNPDVDPQTHPYISTGLKENKFGITTEEALPLYKKAATMQGIDLIGMSSHIGSQITLIQPFLDALDNLLELLDKISECGIELRHLDIGGGLGIVTPEQTEVPYPGELSAALLRRLEGRPYELHMEPGRSLVGNAGYLISRVVGTKEQSGHHFIMLDAGMNDYIRPPLYQVRPSFRNLSQPTAHEVRSEIVGPICETGDTFARAYPLAARRGDVVAMAGAGAYGMAMSGDYNSRPKCAEVLVHDGVGYLVRRRQTVDDLMREEIDLFELSTTPDVKR